MAKTAIAGIAPFFIVTPLGNNDDGLSGLEVRDADGYLLYFGRLVNG
jgi:hypothetical protein